MKANTISGQRQYAFVSQFNYIREAGTEGEEKAACRIEKELSEIAEKWGQGELQIRREPFEIETWQVDEAVFTVTEPYEKTYTVRGCFAAANTAPEGMEAPFLYVENGDPVSLSHAEGKIVLINGGANAGILAAKILATSDAELLAKLKNYSEEMKNDVVKKADKLESIGYKEYLSQMK